MKKGLLILSVLAGTILGSCSNKKTEEENTVTETGIQQETTTSNESQQVTNENVNSSSESSSASEMLKTYESFVDEYIDALKKLDKGSASKAMASLTNMLTKAQELQRQLDDRKSELTENEVARLLKIEAKLAKAANEMAMKSASQMPGNESVDDAMKAMEDATKAIEGLK